MLFFLCAIFLFIEYGESKWSKGIVHYTINQKDYDLHSQDIISSVFEQLQKEICLKFFNTPINHTVADDERILYVSNPHKTKTCPTENYNFDKSVVDMTIGYKCLNEVDISRIVVDMLKASIGITISKPNSNDLLRVFQDQKEDSETLLLKVDRNFINANYVEECGNLLQKPTNARRSFGGTMELTADNERFYKDKVWPLGLVMYGVDNGLITTDFPLLKHAMTIIELSSCIVFQHVTEDDPLQPRNLLWFGLEGEEAPHLGFKEGNQSILMSTMLNGASGHNAHTLNFLMRILGVPMMSNRYDRSNYVRIKWELVTKMKEHYLERAPQEAWLKNTEGEGAAYDFDSVTHASANYMCTDCSNGERTVEPLQDYLWQRTLSMGHRSDLSPADIETLNLLYGRQCQLRFLSNMKK